MTGEEPAYGGGSWLADTASTGHLVPTVIFGPGREPVYMPNEWLDVADIHVAARGERRRGGDRCSPPNGG